MITKKQTWIKIKDDYEKGLVTHTFLRWMCSASTTFADLWLQNEGYIKARGHEFLSTDMFDGWNIGESVLFRNIYATTTEKQQIRLDFINYMIDNCNEEIQVNS